MAITLNFSALKTLETFYILGQGLVTVHQDYYIALQMTNREILPLCGHIEKIMGQQGLHWEYSLNISLFAS